MFWQQKTVTASAEKVLSTNASVCFPPEKHKEAEPTSVRADSSPCRLSAGLTAPWLSQSNRSLRRSLGRSDHTRHECVWRIPESRAVNIATPHNKNWSDWSPPAGSWKRAEDVALRLGCAHRGALSLFLQRGAQTVPQDTWPVQGVGVLE